MLLAAGAVLYGISLVISLSAALIAHPLTARAASLNIFVIAAVPCFALFASAYPRPRGIRSARVAAVLYAAFWCVGIAVTVVSAGGPEYDIRFHAYRYPSADHAAWFWISVPLMLAWGLFSLLRIHAAEAHYPGAAPLKKLMRSAADICRGRTAITRVRRAMAIAYTAAIAAAVLHAVAAGGLYRIIPDILSRYAAGVCLTAAILGFTAYGVVARALSKAVVISVVSALACLSLFSGASALFIESIIDQHFRMIAEISVSERSPDRGAFIRSNICYIIRHPGAPYQEILFLNPEGSSLSKEMIPGYGPSRIYRSRSGADPIAVGYRIRSSAVPLEVGFTYKSFLQFKNRLWGFFLPAIILLALALTGLWIILLRTSVFQPILSLCRSVEGQNRTARPGGIIEAISLYSGLRVAKRMVTKTERARQRLETDMSRLLSEKTARIERVSSLEKEVGVLNERIVRQDARSSITRWIETPEADSALLKHGLTRQERRIVHDLVCGLSYRAAAENAGIAENTVKAHVSHIYRKFGIRSKIELVHVIEEHARQ